MSMQILAEAAGGHMIPGEWITGIVVAIIGAVSAAWAKNSGRKEGLKEATNNITLQNPVPEIPFRKVANPVSYDQHSALDARVARIETHLDRIQSEQSNQYKQILEAGAERELRMTEFMGSGLREVHSRLDEILNHRPRTRS